MPVVLAGSLAVLEAVAQDIKQGLRCGRAVGKGVSAVMGMAISSKIVTARRGR
jgi:hypothetical protein